MKVFDDLVEIKMSYKIKNRLVEFGIYNKWLTYAQQTFNKTKQHNKSDLQLLCDFVQFYIDNDDIKSVIETTVDFSETSDGVEYWEDIHKKIGFVNG